MNRLKRSRAFDEEEKSDESEHEEISELRNSRIIDKASKKPREQPLSIPLLTSKKQSNHQAQPLLTTRAHFLSSTDSVPDSTLQDEALRRLLNPTSVSSIAPIYQKSLLKAVSASKAYVNEKQQFKRDVSLRPDESSLDEYERIPIEAFGAAMLRGMGWNGNVDQGKIKLRGAGSLGGEIKMRPRLLGLGAKPAPVIEKTRQFIKPGETRSDKK